MGRKNSRRSIKTTVTDLHIICSTCGKKVEEWEMCGFECMACDEARSEADQDLRWDLIQGEINA